MFYIFLVTYKYCTIKLKDKNATPGITKICQKIIQLIKPYLPLNRRKRSFFIFCKY